MEDYETFGETYDRPEKPRRIRRPVTAKPNPQQIKPMNDQPSPTVNDIKLPVRITDNDPCLIQDADGIVVARCFTMKEANAIIAALNTTALLAERDALREALQRIDQPYRAKLDGSRCISCGRWAPRNHPEAHDHKEDCPELAKQNADSDPREIARLALAKGGGE